MEQVIIDREIHLYNLLKIPEIWSVDRYDSENCTKYIDIDYLDDKISIEIGMTTASYFTRINGVYAGYNNFSSEEIAEHINKLLA